jgi:peptidoglycan/LPS O-acetylase OafA/YrhL
VLHHYFLPLPWTSAPLRFLAHGYLAVDLFFSLSGFVMALNYAEMFSGGFDLRKFQTFLGRRLARIYPLYLFTLLVAAFLVATRHLEFRAKSFSATFWSDLFMVQNWGVWQSLNPPSWSISAEFFAYLLFPFVIPFMMFRSRTTRILATSACVLGLLGICFYSRFVLFAGYNINYFDGPLSLVRCIAEFGLGLAAYQFASTRKDQTIKYFPKFVFFLAMAILVLLAIRGTDLLLVLLFPVLIVALDGRQTLLSRFLGSGPIQYLGLLSFSIYLSHWLFNPLLGYFDLLAQRAGRSHSHTYAVAAVLPVVFISAVFTYHLIEVPGRRILRTFFEGAPSVKGPKIAL